MAEALSGKTRRKTDSTLSQSEVKKMVTKDLEVTEDKTSGIGYGRLKEVKMNSVELFF